MELDLEAEEQLRQVLEEAVCWLACCLIQGWLEKQERLDRLVQSKMLFLYLETSVSPVPQSALVVRMGLER